MDQFIDAVLGDYHIIKQIGSGSLANVYLAQDVISKVSYAIKIYTCPNSDIRCQNEATILEKIAHQNIIQLRRHQKLILKNREPIQFDCLILEYLEQGDMFEFIAKTGSFEESICLFYFKQLVTALEFMHSKGLVHRNLKLECILLDRKFNLKLSNCSLAQYANKYRDGKLRTRVGTVNYSAPELLFGALYDGAQIDVFSLGVILFIMLKGSPPFVKACQEDKLYNLILQGNYEKFWDIHQHQFSFDFRELFISMIHPNPDQRPTLSAITLTKWYNGVTKAHQDVYEIMSGKEKLIHHK